MRDEWADYVEKLCDALTADFVFTKKIKSLMQKSAQVSPHPTAYRWWAEAMRFIEQAPEPFETWQKPLAEAVRMTAVHNLIGDV